ncbi:MAG: hypothetical protein HRT35_09165 [Algicola sp.]|nr:hypothetical protein [Algicola sp.]
MTGIQLKRVLRFILLASVLIGANAYAHLPGESSDSHDLAAPHFDVIQSHLVTQSIMAAGKIKIETVDTVKSVDHSDCECCDTCQCVSCTGCLGGCAAVAIPILSSSNDNLIYPLDRFESLRARYLSPSLPSLEYPPRHNVAGISC